MNHKPPRTPFATHLSGSARETEQRIRSIFAPPKKRPPALLLALIFAVCLLCGNLVSCQVAEEDASSSRPEGDTSSSQPPEESGGASSQPLSGSTGLSSVQYLESGLDLTPDLNGNGVPEELRLAEADDFDGVMLEVWENGEVLFRRPGERMEGYAATCCLYSREGKDYLLHCSLDFHQGVYRYDYSLADYTGEFEETRQRGSVSFDTNFGTPYHGEFDPEAIAAFMGELDGLMAQSKLLFTTDPDLGVLRWLDQFPQIFTPDPDRSLLENLKDFEGALTAAQVPAAGTPSPLPITEPLALRFSSGVGAWSTELTLNPDGSFTGLFVDADMGDGGENYPDGTRYVCQFHGSLGQTAQLSDASWSLVLEELVLDDGLPMGEIAYADNVRYIYSGPYGLDDAEGEPLEPGAKFILYSPQAQGHAPGTELYGAYDFWTWWPNRSYFTGPEDTLGCWGLNSLETGRGFFS